MLALVVLALVALELVVLVLAVLELVMLMLLVLFGTMIYCVCVDCGSCSSFLAPRLGWRRWWHVSLVIHGDPWLAWQRIRRR